MLFTVRLFKRVLLLGAPVCLLLLSVQCSDDGTGPVANVHPEIELTTCPEASTPQGTDCEFHWQGTDSDGEVVGYHYDLDDDSPDTWTTATCVTLQDVASGQHTFYVQAKDNQNGWSTIASCDFEVTVVNCGVAPGSLDFGSIDAGSSKDLSFVITNNGTGTLAGAVTESCDHYQIVSGSGSYSLEPAGTRTVTVRFAPTSAGTHACTIDLGAAVCTDVSCTGTAVDVVNCGVVPDSRLRER